MPVLEVAVNRPLPRTFHYLAEETPRDPVGCRISVPFGSSRVTGIVVGVSETAPDLPPGVTLKPIHRFIDAEPVIGEPGMRLADWMSRFYFCALGQALATMIPSGIRPAALPDGLLPREAEPLHEPRQEQQEALNTIKAAIDADNGQQVLLHGPPGSGKTEVYRHAAVYAASKGMGVIILVPEIALTPQTVSRFSGIFDSPVALLHSRLTPAQRIGQWRSLQGGDARVAIGARSAVFAPLEGPLLIIMDEEHEQSYKAGDCPRYHARQVAFFRTRREGCLLLGSATPGIETWHHARNGTLRLIEMKARISPHPPPKIDVVNLQEEAPGSVLSTVLLEALRKRLEKKEQSILFMNRRGFSTFLFCRDCDKPAVCPNCSISLNLHSDRGILLCHHCGYTIPFNGSCPACSGKKLRMGGAGTQRVEQFLEKRFPGIRQQRIDSDSMRDRHALHTVLDRFRSGEIDVLTGTQMVGKGLDFPGVTLVGVVFADSELNMPDFRSFERTFIQLTQVLGRSGRADKAGEGIIQTLQPDADPIASATTGDFGGFYERELARRQEGGYPPFSRIIRVVCRSQNEEAAAAGIREAAEALSARITGDARLLGPAPCPLEKIARNYRHHILLMGPDIGALAGAVREAGLAEGSRRQTYLEIDVDPVSLL